MLSALKTCLQNVLKPSWLARVDHISSSFIPIGLVPREQQQTSVTLLAIIQNFSVQDTPPGLFLDAI